MLVIFDGISYVTPRNIIGFEASLVPENIADELILHLIKEDPKRLKIKAQQTERGAWYFKGRGK